MSGASPFLTALTGAGWGRGENLASAACLAGSTEILCRRRTRPIVIICPGADLAGAMNTDQLIFGGFMLIRAAMIALDLAVPVLVLSIGMAAAARLRRLSWSDDARRRSGAR